MNSKRTLSDRQIADAQRLKSLWVQRFSGTISQEEVAHRCGWKTQGAFNQYLNGKIPIGLQALLKISRALNVDPAEISPTLASEIPREGKTAFNLTGEACKPGVDGPPAQALSEIDALLVRASPFSRQQLMRIAEAAAARRLSDADIKMLSDIAKRLEKGSTDHRDDYPNLQPGEADKNS